MTRAPHFLLPKLYPLARSWRECTKPEQLIPQAALADRLGLGSRAVAIAGELKITEGQHAGKHFREVMTQWQRVFLAALFGHVDPDGRRIFRRAFLRVARKNGKTAFAAIIALVAHLTSTEGRPSTLILGGARDQSRLAFEGMAHAIEASTLRPRFKIARWRHQIDDRENGGQIHAIAAELTGAIGSNPSFAVVDELHLIGGLGDRGGALVRALESGQHARAEPMLLFITTAATKEPAGIYLEVLQHARAVFKGEIDDRRTLVVDFDLLEAGIDDTDAG